LNFNTIRSLFYNLGGGEKGPVTFTAFKAGDPFLRGADGGFDSHTLPPNLSVRIASIVSDENRSFARKLCAGAPLLTCHYSTCIIRAFQVQFFREVYDAEVREI
jgi:hypothetical protein